MRHWTAETDAEAATLYATFTEAKIRLFQDLARQQIGMAFAQREQRPGMDDAMEDLQAMHDALSREMGLRLDAGTPARKPRVSRHAQEGSR